MTYILTEEEIRAVYGPEVLRAFGIDSTDKKKKKKETKNENKRTD